MQQRDLLKDQIEELGKVLGKMLSKFFDLIASDNIIDVIQIIDNELQSNLDFDISKIIDLDKNAVENYLLNHQLSDVHFDQIGKYLNELGNMYKNENNNIEAKKYFTAAHRIIEFVTTHSETYSMDRIALLERLQAEINLKQ